MNRGSGTVLHRNCYHQNIPEQLQLREETDFDKLNNIQEQLATKELIRDGLQLFVTTSKNKEGINLNNGDIHHVYIAEHSLTDSRQMAGRLRCGADHAYVIVDSQGHNIYEHPQERWLTRQMCAFDLAWGYRHF